jgi:hypothetical protein
MRPPGLPQPLGQRVTDLLPAWLRRNLAIVLGEQGGPLYLAGGVVRDLLRGVAPADIDLTVRDGARTWAARLAELCGGALVALGRDEDAARVVSGGVSVDFAGFREGATDILDDLTRRDLTINAMALRIDPLIPPAAGRIWPPAWFVQPGPGPSPPTRCACCACSGSPPVSASGSSPARWPW